MPKTKANDTATGTHDSDARVAELERKIQDLERRLAILEAKHAQPARNTRILSEPGITDPLLHGTKSEPDHVHDIEKPA